jgi:transcriptional regulator with XRE-family HTH domain
VSGAGYQRTLSATMNGMDELARCLRAWRDRLAPAEAGLPDGGRRRAPGLRREELARLAGLSVDYLARLEQGRAQNPSPSVLAPLASVLRLSEAERAHLFRVAGHAPPSAGTISREITGGVRRMLDGLGDVPVVVCDAAWTVIERNALARELLGDVEGNIAQRHFTRAPTRIDRDPESDRRFEQETVADLHDALGRYPDDEELRALIAGLRAASPLFAELWEQRPVAPRRADRKTFVHPEIGPITLDCDILSVRGSDLRLIVYTAAPGSPGAEALAALAESAYARASA